MNKKPLLISILIAVLVIIPAILFLTSDRPQKNPDEIAREVEKDAQKDPAITRTYSGVLPCADCTGIETIISLTQKNDKTLEGKYTMALSYIGKDSDAIITKGDWVTENGDRTIIVLNPKDTEKIQKYLLVDENRLVQLDKDGKEIDAPGQNHTLTLM
jgi:hypothetical protein